MNIDAYVTQAAYDSIEAHDPKLAESVAVLDRRPGLVDFSVKVHDAMGDAGLYVTRFRAQSLALALYCNTKIATRYGGMIDNPHVGGNSPEKLIYTLKAMNP